MDRAYIRAKRAAILVESGGGGWTTSSAFAQMPRLGAACSIALIWTESVADRTIAAVSTGVAFNESVVSCSESGSLRHEAAQSITAPILRRYTHHETRGEKVNAEPE